MEELKFYQCQSCGNMIIKLVDKKMPVMCCGQVMKEIEANTTEAASEKHIPVATLNQGFLEVNVGSAQHPMDESHHITFVAIQTKKGITVNYLDPKDLPTTKFYIGETQVLSVYAYCNLHGLWKA